MKSDGNVSISGDGKTSKCERFTQVTMVLLTLRPSLEELQMSVVVVGDMTVSGAVDCGNKGRLAG